MSDMIKLVVDGRTIEAQEGTLLLPTLIKHGFSVPYFCYHDALGPDGNCRMCMVGIEGQKRPQIACDTSIKKDMVVSTNNESITEVKRNILELELLSHPVDCPICDQAGECSLQDYYMDFGLHEAKRVKEEKKLKEKKLDIGKNIILDQERCVLCARCTRFTQEITHTNELSIIGRGNDARVSTVPGEGMKTPYAMNIIDLCPVGALTSKDFRFKQRVWFMSTKKGICHGCAKGCNIYMDTNKEKYKDEVIYRFRPRINENVNGHFICDEGRLSYKDETLNRMTEYFQHNRPISEEKAITFLQHCLQDRHPLIIVSPSLSLEELSMIQLLADKFSLEIHAFSEGYKDDSFGDDWLRSSDRSSNLEGVKKLNIKTSTDSLKKALQCTGLVINFNHQALMNSKPEYLALFSHKKEIHIASHNFDNCKHKELFIPISSFSEREGSLINEDGVLQRFEAALSSDTQNILELLHKLNSTPTSVNDIWDKHLTEVFGLTYENIPPLGVKV